MGSPSRALNARAVDHSTVFAWGEGDAVSHLRATCQIQVDGAYSSMEFHVITKGNSTTLPKGEGIELPREGSCSWQVTIHNAYPTVDAVLHPQGMIAPCTNYSGAMLRGEGSASVSESRRFFLAP